MTSLTALLIGMPDCLPKAYPEALRTEIGKKVRLLSEAVSHKALLRYCCYDQRKRPNFSEKWSNLA